MQREFSERVPGGSRNTRDRRRRRLPAHPGCGRVDVRVDPGSSHAWGSMIPAFKTRE